MRIDHIIFLLNASVLLQSPMLVVVVLNCIDESRSHNLQLAYMGSGDSSLVYLHSVLVTIFNLCQSTDCETAQVGLRTLTWPRHSSQGLRLPVSGRGQGSGIFSVGEAETSS